MSADTRPISASAFASALKDLSLSMLHLKVLEIRNSIAHLQYSNDQLQPFAEGSAVASTNSEDAAAPAQPDQDCIDAIAENLTVIDRMAERIALIRAEVEERGVSWREFEEEVKPAEPTSAPLAPTTTSTAEDDDEAGAEASVTNGARHSAWTDGTFQTGVIRNGEIHMDSTAGQRQSEPEGAGDMARGISAGGQSQGPGGSLSDEQLRRAMEEQMRNLGGGEDEEGMHL